MNVDQFESTRIDEIIEAGRKGDWPAFKALSDEQFLNEDAMQETFYMSNGELQAMSEINVTPFATRLPDGGKGIHCQIKDVDHSLREVTLILRSVKAGDRNKIGILVFVPRPNW